MQYFDKNAMYYVCNAYDDQEKCLNKSIHKNGFCENHQQYNNIGHFDKQDVAYCSAKIKYYLDEFFLVVGKENKRAIITELYEFLIYCMRFLFLNKKFAEQTFTKLLELEKDGFNSSIYLNQLFPYYNNCRPIIIDFPMCWADV